MKKKAWSVLGVQAGNGGDSKVTGNIATANVSLLPQGHIKHLVPSLGYYFGRLWMEPLGSGALLEEGITEVKL